MNLCRWAVVKDVNVYNRMKEYIHQADMEMSKDTLLRALTILRVVTEGDGKKFFNFAHEILRDRWEKISHIFSFSKRFSIQHIPTQYCTFLNRAREPSPGDISSHLLIRLLVNSFSDAPFVLFYMVMIDWILNVRKE